jgi:hypothetical protein
MSLKTHHFSQVPILDSEAFTRHAVLKIDAIPATVMDLPMTMPS